MFIPLGTDLRLRRPTVVNHGLILANVAVFIAVTALTLRDPDQHRAIVDDWGLVWEAGRWWRFVTSAFLHGGAWHLFGNMITLWAFGPAVEDRFGRVGYLLLYLGGMVGSGAAHVLTESAPAIGASGAIAAVSGAFLVLFPRVRIRTFVLFFVIGTFDIPAVWFICAAILKDFMLFGSDDSVARAAHLGGYGVGIAAAFALQLFRVVPREPFDFLSLLRQAKRRGEIRQAARELDEQRERRAPARAGKAAIVDTARMDALATARAEVSEQIAHDNLPAAAAAYRRLLDMHTSSDGPMPGTAVMNRRAQLALGNFLFSQGQHAHAHETYERFLAAYPGDAESPRVELITALIEARYLARPDPARGRLERVMPSLRDEEQRALAKDVLDEIRTKPA